MMLRAWNLSKNWRLRHPKAPYILQDRIQPKTHPREHIVYKAMCPFPSSPLLLSYLQNLGILERIDIFSFRKDASYKILVKHKTTTKKPKHSQSWFLPVISELGRLRQEDGAEFKSSLASSVRLSQNQPASQPTKSPKG